ncbi:hypothetical protein [Polyangium spumosum]|uniref:PLD phosphodiesterase domain-containing protein n=1 Tax=Polyangium spumosum TaxID=889282 RepID=A0A6N7PUI9_9BACT|nr:hypothetical protein [Polyangium spumosum]MRG95718.1 hypothetical protein [Polyangium spumosum]
MNQPTLGLLEKLRPPSGFRTEAALGATYSADLLTCMAVLTTLDGGEGERVQYGRVEAFRALDRLRDKVRICHQAGRVSRRDGSKYPSLALLDRVLVPIRVPGRGSFHPKVWIVRQVDGEGHERFVLIVSSRNITTSTDWDLGIVIEGMLGGAGKALPRVREFAQHALTLAGEPARIETFGKLDDVRWTVTPPIKEMAFDFQKGGEVPQQLHPAWSGFDARPSRVLLLSPFIDARMVGEAAKRWSSAPKRRLVAGPEGLLCVALGPKCEALRALEPRQIVAAPEAPEPAEDETGAESEDEIEHVRALHAKVIAIDDGRRGTVILGSNNLTGPGWCGGSTEAFVRLVGPAALCDPLWDWATAEAQDFDFPAPGTPPPEPPILEKVKDELHAVSFRLEEAGAHAPSRLVMLDPPALELPDGIRMEVARYTMPGQATLFPTGASTVTLPGCTTALRTRFIVCTLRQGDEKTSWIAAADLEPPVDEERDRALVARLLGVREFLAYLQSLRADEAITGSVEGALEGDAPEETQQHGRAALDGGVHLEELLRQLVKAPDAFDEMDRAVQRYGELIKRGQIPEDERVLLSRFLEAWAAIREAFRP